MPYMVFVSEEKPKIKFKTVEGPGSGKEYEADPSKTVLRPQKDKPYTFPSKDGEVVTKPLREVREKKPGKLWIVKDDDNVHALEVVDK